MKTRDLIAAALVFALPLETIAAQTSGPAPKPDAKPTAAPPEDSPEEIAKDAARDLKDTRYYNKPGATRADYDRDWQECRLIARGSRTPGGTIPYFYNPSVISPLAAGIGAGLGGLLAGAIVQGQQRRANRRECLLIKGWRLVDVPASDAARVTAMTDDQRSAYFDTVVGAAEVQGDVTERTSFTFDAAGAGLNLDGPLPRPGTVFVGKKIDPSLAVTPAADEAILLLAFRRPDAGSAGRSGLVNLARYDIAGGDLVYQPRDWKKKGDKTTYSLGVRSRDKAAAYELHILRVTAGSYVINNHAAGSVLPIQSYCFGAPVIEVRAGDVIYLGDAVPLVNARNKLGVRMDGIAWTSNPDDARNTLASKQPALAERMQIAAWRNGATYACAAQTMDRWDLPGVPMLERPTAPATASVVVDPATVPAAATTN